MYHVFSRCLRGDESESMMSNKPLEGKVALPFPKSRMQQLFVAPDLGFLFVVSSILVGQSEPRHSSILRPLERLDRCGI
jgi:hypothetical protein